MRRVLPAVSLLAAVLLVGCSSSLETVEVPPGGRSVRVEPPDIELRAIPPAPPPAAPTEPVEVTLYPETSGATLDLELLTVDRSKGAGRVVVQYQTGDTTRREVYAAPAFGETLDVQPDVAGDTIRDTVATAQVRGAPETRQVEAKVKDRKGWWARRWDGVVNGLAAIGALAILLTATGAALRFTSLTLPV
jgi:hypothetical protein